MKNNAYKHYMEFIPSRLQELRGSKTQAYMARVMGMEVQRYVRYETGQTIPRADTVYWFCKMFNVSADWLFGLKSLNNGDVTIGNNNFNSGRIGADCSNCPVLKAAVQKLKN